MGTTSNKLIYLNETKNKLKEAINLTNANITNDTFRNYEYKLKKGIINTLNNPKTVWDNFEKVESTETAGSITLDPTEYAPMQLDLKGNIEQDSTTGKNLFNPNWFTFRTNNGITATLENDHILLNGTATASAYINFTIPENTFGDGSYTWFTKSDVLLQYGIKVIRTSGGNVDISPATSWNGSTFSSNNATSGYIYVANGTTLSNCKLYIDVREGNVDLTNFDYEPYTNGASPNPSYPQDIHIVSGDNEIKVENKNLFTIKNYSKSGWNITIDNPLKGLSTGDYTISCVNKYITADKGIAIVFSNGTGGNVGYFTGYDFGNTLMNKTTNITQDMINANYLVFMPQDSLCTQEVLESMKIMIVKGTTTDYVEHKEYTKEINLGNLEVGAIGEYEDEFFKNTTDSEYYDSTLEQDKWYLKKRIGKVVLDGSVSSWQVNSAFNTEYMATKTQLGINLPQNSTNFISTHFKAIGTAPASLGSMRMGGTYVCLNYDGGVGGIDNFKTWLQNNNVEVYYVLATPENILLNDTLQETLDSFYSMQGQTNISQSNNDLPFVIKARVIREIAETAD